MNATDSECCCVWQRARVSDSDSYQHSPLHHSQRLIVDGARSLYNTGCLKAVQYVELTNKFCFRTKKHDESKYQCKKVENLSNAYKLT